PGDDRRAGSAGPRQGGRAGARRRPGRHRQLGKFASRDVRSADGAALFIARTGYTGEDGFEVALPVGQAVAFWDALVAAGVAPAGLGARDTLRLEAGLPLYGQDMD